MDGWMIKSSCYVMRRAVVCFDLVLFKYTLVLVYKPQWGIATSEPSLPKTSDAITTFVLCAMLCQSDPVG